jgi:hypothetical protein
VLTRPRTPATARAQSKTKTAPVPCPDISNPSFLV